MYRDGQVALRPLFEKESSTYTYLLWDVTTMDGVVIDPVKETYDRDIQVIEQLGINIKYGLETHLHADHITSVGPLSEKFGFKKVLSKNARTECADIEVSEGDEIKVTDDLVIKVIESPGHTDCSVAFYVNNFLFTGDALLIRGCGRTDFQNGDAKELFKTIREKFFKLPDETLVFPAHDYKGRLVSTIGEEKKFNERANLNIDESGFIEIMSNLNLPKPKKIDVAVPANKRCGD